MPCACTRRSASGDDIDVLAAANPQLSGHTRRATLPWHALRSVDKAPRNTPEKLASPTSAGIRHRWSGPCTPARGARLTNGRSGGGSVGSRPQVTSTTANMLAVDPCICSRIVPALLNVAGRPWQPRETTTRPLGLQPSGSWLAFDDELGIDPREVLKTFSHTASAGKPQRRPVLACRTTFSLRRRSARFVSGRDPCSSPTSRRAVGVRRQSPARSLGHRQMPSPQRPWTIYASVLGVPAG